MALAVTGNIAPMIGISITTLAVAGVVFRRALAPIAALVTPPIIAIVITTVREVFVVEEVAVAEVRILWVASYTGITRCPSCMARPALAGLAAVALLASRVLPHHPHVVVTREVKLVAVYRSVC